MTAALPVISALGVEACPLPTAILSNQTGYPSFYCDDFTDRLTPYIAEWQKRQVHFDGILTGFLVSAQQAERMIEFIEDFKTEDTLYICDPVMADDGRLYGTYTGELCEKMTELSKLADIITPNLTELCLLTGANYREIHEKQGQADYLPTIEQLAKSLLNERRKTVVVTGILNGDSIVNIVVTADSTAEETSKRFGGSYSGTGDLFSAVLAGSLVRGDSADAAVKRAVRFLECTIKDSFLEGNDRNDGVNFQKYMAMLTEKTEREHAEN